MYISKYKGDFKIMLNWLFYILYNNLVQKELLQWIPSCSTQYSNAFVRPYILYLLQYFNAVVQPYILYLLLPISLNYRLNKL